MLKILLWVAVAACFCILVGMEYLHETTKDDTTIWVTAVGFWIFALIGSVFVTLLEQYG